MGVGQENRYLKLTKKYRNSTHLMRSHHRNEGLTVCLVETATHWRSKPGSKVNVQIDF